jgi:hypothetical protein
LSYTKYPDENPLFKEIQSHLELFKADKPYRGK